MHQTITTREGADRKFRGLLKKEIINVVTMNFPGDNITYYVALL